MNPLRAISRYGLDILAVTGLGLVAYGLGQAPAPWGAMLAPLVLGLGLIGAARYGAR